ncbi:MAG: PEGA domain-containing protein [Elusimicrobia bacterium]|nr:PEGA domain-containing protein [Elusimicrobiota bacterium]
MNRFLVETSFSGFVCAMLAAISLTGCASIISGTSQEVSFHSTPEGATVSVSGKTLGKTPVTMAIKKKSGQSLSFEKDGYKTVSLRLETRMNSWFWGNIVLGGFLGSTTDGVSGAVNEYSPSQYMVTLEPAGTGNLDGKTTGSKSQKARGFIVTGYNNILAELVSGSGPYIASLLKLLDVPEGEMVSAIKKIRALSEVYKDIPEFADHVIDLYIKE